MKALAFGEILWDVFGGKKTIGGAPLNVLGHIRRLGGEATIISAVGDDELGKASLSRLDELGIDSSYVHLSQWGTGRAVVSLCDGIPSYAFDTPAAWDGISLSATQLDALEKENWDVFVYGTLAQRGECSAATLSRLLERVNAREFFFDVNLRLDYYSRACVERGLERASILKMNDEELPVIASLLGRDEKDFIPWLLDCTGLRRVILTSGKKGSDCYEKGRTSHAGTQKVEVVDTVGAGDSLSAAFLYFISQGDDSAEALSKASILADYVVTRTGAIPEYDVEIRQRLGLSS